MRQAETVTFGGSGLDRAHALRGDAPALTLLAARPGARSLALWRGKPLLTGQPGGLRGLARLAADHPVLTAEPGLVVFLGLDDDGEGIWAEDVSQWSPDEADLAATGGFFDPSEQHHPALPADHLFAELRAAMTSLDARDAELAATARALFAWHESHGFCARCGERSQPVMAGWQRDCPACGAHHFPRTDPVVIMLVTRGNDLLLGRSPGWPPGMYSLLAGFIEPGETVEAAVRREVFEETAVRCGPVRYLASQPWPFPASLMMGCHAEALSSQIQVDPNEIEDAIWIPREALARIIGGVALPSDPGINPPRPGSIARFLMENWLADRLDGRP